MPQKIIVIEDDKFLRELIVKKLVKESFTVVEATDGEEGVNKIATEKPDLVLLDLILPTIDGFEVLKRVKENPYLKDIPIIVLSNLGQNEDVEKCMQLGATDYLIKAHFTPAEIIEKTKNILKIV